MKKDSIKDVELNKKKGQRLQECRLDKKMKQGELAEKAGYAHSQSITMFETGKRKIHTDTAITMAKILDVNYEYIMCTSDLKRTVPRYSQNPDIFDTVDSLFIQSLILRGYDIKFIGTSEIRHADDICISNMNNFVKFSLGSPDACKIVLDNGEEKELIIHTVIVDDKKLSVGTFLFLFNRIYDYIDFTFSNWSDFSRDYGMCIHGTDNVVKAAIAERGNVMERLKEFASLNEGVFLDWADAKTDASTNKLIAEGLSIIEESEEREHNDDWYDEFYNSWFKKPPSN